ncbi:proline-rich protein 36-like [Engraulis encrasicolus]|uniref:proline-rich protein 36-like n=1 Tax=Engraulis encrasicolus TaxID=184585 RepID=UPI002FD3719E
MAQVFMPRSLPTTLSNVPSSRLASGPSSTPSNESTPPLASAASGTPSNESTTPPLASAASSFTPNVSPDSSLDNDDVPPSILHPSLALSSPPPPSLPASTLSLPTCLPSLAPILPSTSTSTTTTTPPRLPASLPPVPVPCKARRTFSRLSLLEPPSSLPTSHLEAIPSQLPPLDLSALLKALGATSSRVAPLPPIQVRAAEEREDMESGMESTEESDDEMATVVVWSCDQEVEEEDGPCDLEVTEEELQEKKIKKKKNSFKNRIVKFFRRLNCFHCGEDSTRDGDF